MYIAMAEMKLNEEIAKAILKLPKKYIPEYIKIGKKKQLLDFDKSKTLWDVYNDITAQIWHNQKMDIVRKNLKLDAAHSVILPLIKIF
jgi:hypothetical protein